MLSTGFRCRTGYAAGIFLACLVYAFLAFFSDMTKRATQLRSKIIRALKKQGYLFRDGEITIPKDSSKDDVRRMHELAVKHTGPCLVGCSKVLDYRI